MWRCFTRKYEEERHLLQNKKIREFEKILLRSKRFEKLRKNDLIRKAAQNMNDTNSTKYNLAPETIGKRSLNPYKRLKISSRNIQFCQFEKNRK